MNVALRSLRRASPRTSSRDGQKLLYRAPGGGGGRGAGAAPAAGPALFVVDADRRHLSGTGRLNVTLQMYLEPKESSSRSQKGGAPRDYLYVQNMHGSTGVDEEMSASCCLTHAPIGFDFLLDNMRGAGNWPLVRARGRSPDAGTSNGGLLGADLVVENGRYKITRIYDTENGTPSCERRSLRRESMVGGDYCCLNAHRGRSRQHLSPPGGTANRQTFSPSTTGGDGGRESGHGDPRRQRAGITQRAFVKRTAEGSEMSEANSPTSICQHRQAAIRVSSLTTSRNRTSWAWSLTSASMAADRRRLHHRRAGAGLRRLLQQRRGDRYPFTSPSAGIWDQGDIINEMAGSGGDLMPYMFRRRGLGPLIGTTTWAAGAHADTPGFTMAGQ